MPRQIGRFYFERCRVCDALFTVDRMGVAFLVCEKCRPSASGFAVPSVRTVVRQCGTRRVIERGHCPIAPWFNPRPPSL